MDARGALEPDGAGLQQEMTRASWDGDGGREKVASGPRAGAEQWGLELHHTGVVQFKQVEEWVL